MSIRGSRGDIIISDSFKSDILNCFLMTENGFLHLRLYSTCIYKLIETMCNFARYAFGDSRKPSTDSASLIEEIVHSQMASMVFVFIMATFALGTGA